MKKIINNLFFIVFVLVTINCHAMQEWLRTNLQNLGVTQPKLSATEELKQIIEREGTFKKAGLKRIQQLIGMQADANLIARDGKTPLLIAIADYEPSDKPSDELLVVRLLAEFAKTDINKIYSGEGFTPLAIAAYDGKANIIPILLRFGADIKTRDKNGNTPLILVTRLSDQKNAVAVAKQLLDAGIDINAQNNNGETALYRAVLKKNYALIRFLIENGADASIATNQGQTPLALAQANADQQAIDLLMPKSQRI